MSHASQQVQFRSLQRFPDPRGEFVRLCAPAITELQSSTVTAIPSFWSVVWPLPVYPDERTSSDRLGMSQKCQLLPSAKFPRVNFERMKKRLMHPRMKV
jgi:hypothetical protein